MGSVLGEWVSVGSIGEFLTFVRILVGVLGVGNQVEFGGEASKGDKVNGRCPYLVVKVSEDQ